MKLGWQADKWLSKKSKGGFRGYPIGTLAFYGPDDQRASKLVACVFFAPGSEPAEMRKWFDEQGDLRTSATVLTEVSMFLRMHGVRSITLVEGIFGCPHEEAVDYPQGQDCPQCAFWADRDRYVEQSRK